MKSSVIFLFCILFIGLGLRLYQWDALSLGNDDLSTLTRTRYDSFSELIAKGVKTDVHPAGLQIFMYYWTCLFGYGELAVRLPFILMGLGSVFLAYVLGRQWANETCGLLMAAALACWQYVLMHHISIRMYTSGMFFVLGMTLCWTNMLWQPEKRPWLNSFGYVLLAVFCCYNHYFSMLMAGIIGITALFFLRRNNRTAYLISNLAVLVLFLPHLPVFLHQLGMKGIGSWLAKPTLKFFPDYFSFIFHHSILQMLMVGGLVIWGVVSYVRKYKDSGMRPFRWIALIWFILPIVIGYTYSVLREPVMHYGGLFFSFPFLLLFLFSFLPKLSFNNMALLLITFMSISIYTLVWERGHYDIFYHRGIKPAVQKSLALIEAAGEDSVVSIAIVNHPYYANYYLDQWSPATRLDSYELADFIHFRNWLEQQSAPHLTVFWVAKAFPLEYISLIEEYYPYLIEEKRWPISEYYYFTKHKPVNYVAPQRHFESIRDFKKKQVPYWTDVTTGSVFQMDSLTGYSPTFSAPLSDICRTDFDILEIEAFTRFDSISSRLPQLVLAIEREGKTIHWQAVSLDRFISKPHLWQHAYLAVRMRHLNLVYDAKSKLSTYIWNPAKVKGQIASMTVRVRPGNEYLYALVEKVKKPWDRVDRSGDIEQSSE